MRRRVILAAGLAVTMLTGMLAGCGKQEPVEEEIPAEQRAGRYVEKEAVLPEEWADRTAQQIFVRDDRLHIVLTKQEGETLRICEMEQTEDGFTDVTGEWLSGMALPAAEWPDLKLMQDGNGVQYLFSQYTDETGEYKPHLWRSDGEDGVEITPEYWNAVDEDWGFGELVSGIAALDDGRIFSNGVRYLSMLSGQDGSVQESADSMGEYAETTLSDGRNVYLAVRDDNGAVTRIEKRTDGKENAAEEIVTDMENTGSIQLCVAADGTLYGANGSGIFRYTAGSTEWERLLPGTETDFPLSDRWCIGLAATTDGRLYALFGQDERRILKEYVYDPDAVVEVTDILKLYAVEESYLLQNAIALYHREHPEVMIEAEYAYTLDDKYGDTVYDYNEVFQKLNTKLMSEDAPDILVLDHMDRDAFVRKGLLADLGDVLAPMEASGELLTNITDCYKEEDGSCYMVPLQFSFSYITGRNITKADMQSLEELAVFLSGKTESYLGARTVADLVDQFYPFFCAELVKDKALDSGLLLEKLESLKRIADNCGIVESYDEQNGRSGHCYNMWDLASTVKLAMDGEAKGFNDCMLDVALSEYIRGDFTAFENRFCPVMEIAVCTKSVRQETAKDFIGFVLSETVQDQDYYSGFPVNAGALEKLAGKDRSDLAAETTITGDDGSEVAFVIGAYSDETAARLVEICKGLNAPVREDEKIRETLIETLGAYLTEQKSLGDTVTAIEDGLRMYLAE